MGRTRLLAQLNAAQGEVDQQHAAAEPGSAPVAPVPLVTVGAVEDPAEVAADRLAEAALASIAGPADARVANGDGEQIRREASSDSRGGQLGLGAKGGTVDPQIQSRLNATKGSGEPLAAEVGGEMEQAFGRSFAGVRLHTDGEAGALADSMTARAFTHGSDIYFAKGQYDAGSAEGRRVLAHELAHTVQQSAGIHRLWNPFKKKTQAEKEAEAQKKKEKEEQKAKEKKEAKEKLEAIKGSKQRYSDRKEHDESERRVGKQNRAYLSERITGELGYGEMVSGDEIKESTQAAKAGAVKPEDFSSARGDSTKGLKEKVDDMFAAALEQEETLRDKYVADGLSAEAAYDKAYKQIWLDTKSQILHSIRPMRETPAERLVYQVMSERTEEGVHNTVQNEHTELSTTGNKLSKEVLKFFEDWESDVEEAWETGTFTNRKALEDTVYRTTFSMLPKEIQEKVPTDPRIVHKARVDARTRLAAKKKLAPEKPTDELQEASETAGSVNKYTGWAKYPVKGIGKIVGAEGKKKDKELNAGLPEAPSTSSSSDPNLSNAEKVPILGSAVKSIDEAKFRKDHDLATDDQFEKYRTPTKAPAKSRETSASEGIGIVTGVLTGITSTVSGIMKAVTAVRDAVAADTHRARAAAAKSCSDGVKSAGGLASSTANLAKFINPDVKAGVASVIPGFNIATSILGLISSLMTMSLHADRMDDTNKALDDAHSRNPKATSVDAMIYPLMHLHEGWVKKLEEAVWNTAMSVKSVGTSIATVASAGGFGIPAAIDAGASVLDALHKVGHFIADQVLVALAKKSQSDWIGKKEGSAEQRLERDPAMAVDGIIVSARSGDKVAMAYLNNYGIEEDEVKTGKLSEIRATVLKDIGEDADPAYAYEKFSKMAGGFAGKISDQWKKTGELAKARGTQDDKQRGFLWKVKMFLKGGDLDKSVYKTEAMQGVACTIGNLYLFKDATDSEIEDFKATAMNLNEAIVENALKDKRNAGAGSTILVAILEEKAKQRAKVLSGAKGKA